MNTSTKTTLSILLIAWHVSPTATAVDVVSYGDTTTSTVMVNNLCDTRTAASQDDVVVKRKKSYRARYRKISNSDWFNQHYNNKSLGEVEEIVD